MRWGYHEPLHCVCAEGHYWRQRPSRRSWGHGSLQNYSSRTCCGGFRWGGESSEKSSSLLAAGESRLAVALLALAAASGTGSLHG